MVLTLILFLWGVVYLLNRDEIIIQKVLVEGNNSIASTSLTNFVLEKLNGKYLFLFPRNNIFIYPRKSIEEALLSDFKRIKGVEVSFDSFDSIHISIEEREPHALWCGENRLEEAVPDCYFLDESGFIYVKAPAFTGDIYFRFYGPLEESNPIGQSFLDEKTFREFDLFLVSLREKNIHALELALPGVEDYELYLQGGTKIFFPRDKDLFVIFDNLYSVLSSDALSGQGNESIDYIDLRFGNKVYYKTFGEGAI